ncbi:MAG: hypothetical protein HYT72_04510 [Candidatus Aenigmarchaeota archaeon]|nr:hypothetical protein [Candidatus Aenigmarchaeota archaeon]
MPIRGLLYRKLMEKKRRVDKKEKKSVLRHKNIPAPSRQPQTSRLQRFFKRPVTNTQSLNKAVDKKETSPDPSGNEFALVKGRARYWGGHFLYPIKTVELGELVVRNDFIAFIKYGFLKRVEWSIEIPLSKIEWKKISQVMEEDGVYNITCFTIPFTDEKGVRHQPKFSIENSAAREGFSRFLYERMAKKK